MPYETLWHGGARGVWRLVQSDMANHLRVARKLERADDRGGNDRNAATCGHCGHGLEGLVVIRCPECGHLLDDRSMGKEELALTTQERIQLGICGAGFLVLAYFAACMFGVMPTAWTLFWIKSFTFMGSQYVGLLVMGVLVTITCVYMLPAVRGFHTPRTKRACEWFRDDYVD